MIQRVVKAFFHWYGESVMREYWIETEYFAAPIVTTKIATIKMMVSRKVSITMKRVAVATLFVKKAVVKWHVYCENSSKR